MQGGIFMYRIAVCEDEANVREQLCSCCDDILLKPISKAELSDAIAADIRINHSSDSVG